MNDPGATSVGSSSPLVRWINELSGIATISQRFCIQLLDGLAAPLWMDTTDSTGGEGEYELREGASNARISWVDALVLIMKPRYLCKYTGVKIVEWVFAFGTIVSNLQTLISPSG